MYLRTLIALVASSMMGVAAHAQTSAQPEQQVYVVPQGTVLRVQLKAPMKPGKLKPGSEVEGELTHPLYVYDREVLPAGTHLHAVVGDVEHHKEAGKPGFMAHLQTIRSLGLNRKMEYDVQFQTAALQPPSGAALPVEVGFIDAGDVVELHSKGDQLQVGGTTSGDYLKRAPGVGKIDSIKNAKKKAKEYRHPELSLITEQPVSLALPLAPSAPLVSDVSSIPAGTHARLLLLDELSAADNKQGDIFHARVLEPIVEDGKLLVPEGSVLQGHIGKVIPPRRLSRSASLYLAFDSVAPPNGPAQPVAAALVGTSLNDKKAGKMDDEGGLHGNGRGAKKTLERFGVGLASQQVADEVVELGMHAAGPYVSIPMGLFIFLGGHGRDVELPRYSELEISFGRPMAIGQPPTPPLSSRPQEGPERK